MIEEYVEECKNDYKESGYDNENTEDLPQDVNEVIDDLHECIDDFEEHSENCFKYCSKRNIMSITNMANALMDPKTQVEGGLLNMAETLIIPAVERFLNSSK